MLASKDFTAAKQKITSSVTQPDDHWIKSLMLILLSYSQFQLQFYDILDSLLALIVV